ncbi:MAG: hypothetical protein H7237_10015 [Alkalinema sp. FL-bin-369]|nr:hypothetical protein [Leptolyngbyaceae cyanobacterium LF-bin-369]
MGKSVSQTVGESDRFNLSPLIRITLLSLYFALTLPLPYLADATHAEVPGSALWAAIVLGAIGLYGALDERVLVDEVGIRVTYPTWFPFRRGWQLDWAKVKALKDRSTGQGGLVYYFVSTDGEGFLLPMRVAGFARLLRFVEARTDLDTRDVRPLSQPWMDFFLLTLTGLLGLVDVWAIVAANASQLNG